MATHRVRNAAHLASAVRSATRPGGPTLWQRLRAVPRMIRAVRSGQYTGLSSTRLLMMLAGVGYVVSPVDIVPEGLLLAFGLVDDVLVIGWLATTLVRETEDFIAWEQGATAAAAGAHHGAPQWEQPIPSYVVPD
ncbi:YkvA family protein [Janibacter hoylei]|uniref:YkvA family protein n=1 Tax=unclassified Janibacter TaxID=2649294 RepID=UPI003F930050